MRKDDPRLRAAEQAARNAARVASAFGTRPGPEEQFMHGHTSWGAPARPRRGAAAAPGRAGRPAIGRGGASGRLRRRRQRQDQWSGQLGGASGGATSTTRAGASSDLTQAALAHGRCMRRHGINVPDPQVTADGIDEQVPAGMRKDDPRLRAARQAERTCPPVARRRRRPAPRSVSRRWRLPGACASTASTRLDPQITASVSASIPGPTRTDDPRLSAAGIGLPPVRPPAQ